MNYFEYLVLGYVLNQILNKFPIEETSIDYIASLSARITYRAIRDYEQIKQNNQQEN